MTLPVAAKTFNADSFMLPNGMQVVVIPNHRAPIVSHMVWYRVGAADDPNGKSGIAHFFEHLMFKGTQKVPAGEISRIIARNGGQDNAFTSYDFTAYYQNIALDRLPLVMELEADRMQNLALKNDDVITERSVVLEERRQTLESDPARRLQEKLNSILFEPSTYSRPIIGWRPEIEHLDKLDADSFYARWYAPNNAILVVSGDITARELKPLAEKYYGSIPPRDVPQRERAVIAESKKERRVELSDESVQQPSVTLAWLGPSYGSAGDYQPYAAQVLSQILGGGETSRLYKNLVIKQRIAADAGVNYNPYALGKSSFMIYAVPVPDENIDKIEDRLKKEIKDALKKPFTAEDVARAKQQLIASATYARDSVMNPAYIFGMALTIGKTIDDVESWPDKIEAVTPEQVNGMAAQILQNHSPVVAVLLPARTGGIQNNLQKILPRFLKKAS